QSFITSNLPGTLNRQPTLNTPPPVMRSACSVIAGHQRTRLCAVSQKGALCHCFARTKIASPDSLNARFSIDPLLNLSLETTTQLPSARNWLIHSISGVLALNFSRKRSEEHTSELQSR